MATTNPKFSIIIPTYNNVQGLLRCVKAVYALSEETREPTEILIVSNGSEEIQKNIHGIFSGAKEQPFVKLRLFHSNQMGFSPACNMGLKYAKGDYFILLNDDAIPSIHAFQEMVGAAKSAEAIDATIKIGFAGPMLNRVKGVQQISDREWPFIHDPSAIEFVAQKLAEQAKAKPAECGDQGKAFKTTETEQTPFCVTGDVSGTCLLITKQCYEDVGPLAVYGLGGFEDNDFCIRAIEKGYLGVLAIRAFVYHDMNVTFGALDPNNRNATATLQQFVSHWYHPRKQTLCISYYVKIDTELQAIQFKESLDRIQKLADHIVIFDDRSGWSIQDMIDEYGFTIPVTIHRKEIGEQDEPKDRNYLLDMARKSGCDWIWNLDHDEFPDSRLTPELLHRLLNPINPQIMSYTIPLSIYWRGREKIRVDGVWGNIRNRSLFRNLPAFGQILPYGDSPFHCERAPAFLPGNVKVATFAFSVEHTGYDDYEEVKRKQRHYQTKDTVKNERLIGSKNYEHLTNEGELCLMPFGTPTTTLLMMARNERHDVLRSLYLHSHLFTENVVVSNGSIDGTAEACQKLGVRVIENACCEEAKTPDHMTCDFAAARNFAIEQCKTDYIMFLDPDEELSLRELMLYDKILLEDLDAYLCPINNFNRDAKNNLVNYMTKQPRLFKNRAEIRYNDRVHEVTERSFTENPHLRIAPCMLTINHYGFLKTNKKQREQRNADYAKKLMEMLQEEPDNYRALHALAINLRDNGDKDTAIELMNRSIEVNPTFFIPRLDLALLFAEQIHYLIASLPEKARPADDPRWQTAMLLARDVSKYLTPKTAP